MAGIDLVSGPLARSAVHRARGRPVACYSEFGSACHTPSARFWDEGLVRYVAGPDRAEPPYDAEAGDRCRHSSLTDCLPSIQELISDADVRMSSAVVTAASAFTEHLVSQFGLSRYIALLRAARSPTWGSRRRLPTVPPATAVWTVIGGGISKRAGRQQYSALATIVDSALLLPYWWSGLVVLFYALVGSDLRSHCLDVRLPDQRSARPSAAHRAIPFVGSAGHVIGAGGEQLRILFGLLVVLAALYVRECHCPPSPGRRTEPGG